MTYRSMVATGILSLLLMGAILAHDAGTLNALPNQRAMLAALPYAPTHSAIAAGSINRVRGGGVQLAALPIIKQRTTKMSARPIIWAMPDATTQHHLIRPAPVRMIIILPVPAVS
jgi:hypothetical protein